MKKIIVILLTSLFLSCGTDQGSAKDYIYTVKNSSEKSVVVKSYFPHDISISPVITNFEIGEIKTKRETDYPPSYGETSFRRFFGEGRDSIVVIFNNEKIKSYVYSCSGNRLNPLDFCKYNNEEEVFEFTQEDYTNAEDCNGNCD